MTEAPQYLRAGEIARLVGISLRTARRWIAEETLPSVKLGGARLVPRKGLEALLSATPWEGSESGSETEA